jgi:hypothetical protein
MRPVALLTLIATLAGANLAAEEPTPVDYATHVKPLFAKHCVKCHGAEKREAGLRLDLAAELVKGGDSGRPIVAGKPAESLLYTVLLDDGDVSRMPYDLPPLSAAEIEVVERWIAEGATIPEAELARRAEGSDHWAFQPIRRPVPPADATDRSRNAIDRFVLAALERERLEPSPEADRATLIRRVSLDLTGLLPTPAEVDAFLADERPDAYDRLVDRLLASPRYGEQWGRHWLDLARYADSNGFTIDGERSIWPYRDWVIDALNANQPFDRFVVEQLAGDLLPNATREQLVATGFHRNTLVNQEGGTDPEQFRVEAIVDRTSTTGAVFLGLTVGCAQCHTHKFDPITQREFYELYAFFDNTEDVNAVSPTLAMPTPEQAARQRELKSQLAAAQRALREYDAERKTGRDDWSQRVADLPPIDWRVHVPVDLASLNDARLTTQDDGSVFVGGDGNVPGTDTFTVTLEPETSAPITAIRLETLLFMGGKGPGLASNGNLYVTEAELEIVPAQEGAEPRRVPLGRAVSDWSQEGYPAGLAIDGNGKTGWAINVAKGQGSINTDRELILVPAAPLDVSPGDKLVLRLVQNHGSQYLLGRFRLSLTTDPVPDTIVPAATRAALAKSPKQRSGGEQALVDAAYGGADAVRKPLEERVGTLEKDAADLAKQIPTTMILRERKSPRETHVMIRGNFLQHGDVVEPDVLDVLPPLGDGEQRDRLALANWIVDGDNPLPARVTVNRYWQRFFGVGLVETENDFGTQGTPPSHPELLDWLASEFVRGGLDVKRLHRTIVTSATYRQSSRVSPQHAKLDPANKWLARQSRIRLQAEAVRDVGLAASGLLVERHGGPGVHPPQPGGIRLLTQVNKPWPEEQGPDRYRRGLYTFFWRSNPYPFLLTFDAPGANTTCTRRTRSNTPLQALTLANDLVFVEFARGLAERLLDAEATDDATRLDRAFSVCLSRAPSAAERTALLDYVSRQRRYYASNEEAATSLADPESAHPTTEAATWTALARVLLNVDEFITRE